MPVLLSNNQLITCGTTMTNLYYSGSTTSSLMTSTTGSIYLTQPFSSTTATTSGFHYSIQNGFLSTSTCSNTIYYNSSYSYPSVILPKKPPYIKKNVKSSIKRALNLFANFGMEEDVRVFLSGETMELSHPDSMFKFVISKRNNSLIRNTEFAHHSTPYNLSLYTKSSIHIADLCVIFQDTPILDQVLALNMFISTGNEEDILLKANYNRLTSDIELRKILAKENPKLTNKLKVNSRMMEDIAYR